jgi:hypothetical protein
MGAPVSALMRRMTNRGTVAAARLGWEAAAARLEKRAACVAKSIVAKTAVFVLAGVRGMEVRLTVRHKGSDMVARLSNDPMTRGVSPLTRK